MFSFFKKPKPPAVSAGNPGKGHQLRAAFSNGEKSWSEDVDLLAWLREALTEAGHDVVARKHWLELLPGLTLYPQIWNFTPREDSGVQVASTIQVGHPLLMPEGLFEYQHARGDNLRDAFVRGFKGWAQLDLPVYLDALREKPANSMVLSKSFPNAHGTELHRRALLGPTAQYVNTATPELESAEHEFCACCLFTKSLEAFEPLFAVDRFVGLRMYAARDEHGGIEADCRVNGEDYPRGAEALMRYVESWPIRGFEYRKQYAVLQTRREGHRK